MVSAMVADAKPVNAPLQSRSQAPRFRTHIPGLVKSSQNLLSGIHKAGRSRKHRAWIRRYTYLAHFSILAGKVS